MAKKENIYTHIEDTMSNIYLNGNMLNSGTVMVMLEEKDQRIKDLEQQLAIYKRALELACEDIQEMYCSDYCMYTTDENCKEKCDYQIYFDKEQFIDRAKKELEEQDDK